MKQSKSEIQRKNGLHACREYRIACENIAQEFTKKYFTYDDDSVADYYIIGFDNLPHLAPYAFCIEEDLYYNISEAYESLKSDLPKEKVISRAADFDKRPEGVNFYNYCRYWMTPKNTYTKEEKKKDLDNIRETYKQLLSSMWVTKTNKEIDDFMKQL